MIAPLNILDRLSRPVRELLSEQGRRNVVVLESGMRYLPFPAAWRRPAFAERAAEARREKPRKVIRK